MQISQEWWQTPAIPVTCDVEDEVGRARTKAHPGQKLERLHEKPTEAKRAGSMVQVTECLPRKQGPEFQFHTDKTSANECSSVDFVQHLNR
jgi:hypothetical protein